MLPTPFALSGLRSHHRIALLTDGFSSPFLGKTAISLIRYRGDDIAAVIDREHSGKQASDLFGVGQGVPVLADVDSIDDCDAVYVGIAPPGGRLPESWRAIIKSALRRGLDVVSGLHDFLSEDPEYVAEAAASGAHLVDVRRNEYKLTGKAHHFRRGNVRVHTVGQDCSLGKMVTALEVQRGLQAAGHTAKFLATGQTGIMVNGEGVPVDCVVSDFVNGAAEALAAAHEDADFSIIEGQGSVSHPAFSAVTVGLLHGAAPDGLIYCYEAGRTHVKGLDHRPLAPPEAQMRVLDALANLHHPCHFIGVAVNTRHLNDRQAVEELRHAEQRFGLPACDVYRDGAEKLVRACIELRREVLGE